MIKTLKHLKINHVMAVSMFLLFNSVQASPIHFSSDQWPKRWGRAMNKLAMNGTYVPSEHRSSMAKKVSNQGWGQPKREERRRYSRTPEYNSGSHERYETDTLKRRYAVPGSLPQVSPYGSYPIYGTPGGYGAPGGAYYPGTYSGIHPGMYSGAYSGMYPGVYPGTYPGLYQGLGHPGMGLPGMGVPGLGFPYSSPLLMAPGLTPGLGYPW